MRVLAIESSCDESAAAVLDDRDGLIAHGLFSQIELHRAYGGVVPELASRDHVRRLLPLVESALNEARARAPGEIQGVAYTAGPGLIGALLTGAALARSLAFALGRAGTRRTPPRGASAGTAARARAAAVSARGTAGLRAGIHS